MTTSQRKKLYTEIRECLADQNKIEAGCLYDKHIKFLLNELQVIGKATNSERALEVARLGYVEQTVTPEEGARAARFLEEYMAKRGIEWS